MALTDPIFQGNLQNWDVLRTTIMGTPINGLRTVTFKITKKNENIFATGSEVIGVSQGNSNYEGSLTMLWETYQGMVLIAPEGNVCKIPFFPVIGVFTHPETGIISYFNFQNCSFTESGYTVKNNDGFIDVTLPLRITKIVQS